MGVHKEKAATSIVQGQEEREEEELEEEAEVEEEELWLSDSEIGEALDWLDSRESLEGDGTSAAFSIASSRRPNAHGGVLSRPFQPLSNRNQKYTSHIRASPLEVSFFFSMGFFSILSLKS